MLLCKESVLNAAKYYFVRDKYVAGCGARGLGPLMTFTLANFTLKCSVQQSIDFFLKIVIKETPPGPLNVVCDDSKLSHHPHQPLATIVVQKPY